jgi:hypothetical protein
MAWSECRALRSFGLAPAVSGHMVTLTCRCAPVSVRPHRIAEDAARTSSSAGSIDSAPDSCHPALLLEVGQVSADVVNSFVAPGIPESRHDILD